MDAMRKAQGEGNGNTWDVHEQTSRGCGRPARTKITRQARWCGGFTGSMRAVRYVDEFMKGEGSETLIQERKISVVT